MLMTSVVRLWLTPAGIAFAPALIASCSAEVALLLRGAARRVRLREGCEQRKFAQQASQKMTARSFAATDSSNNGTVANANIFCLLKFRIHCVSVLYLRLSIPEAAHAMRLVSA